MLTQTAGPQQRSPRSAAHPKRFVLATCGSFGDLHPILAIAIGLRERGHQVRLATSPEYREKVEGEGVEFRPLRPSMPHPDQIPALMRRAMDERDGTRFVVRELLMPHVRDQYADFAAAAEGADFLVSHPVTYGAPVYAEKHGVPWAGASLQPGMLTSAYEPPTVPGDGSRNPLWSAPPLLNRLLIRLFQSSIRSWARPVDELRAELGLKRGAHPIFGGAFSPYLNLALFSGQLGQPQPDWPARMVLTGFPFYDRLTPNKGMPPELRRFLDSGPPPLVFTLGSSAVADAGDFYVEAARAAQRLGREGWNRLPEPPPSGVITCEYAPHGELFAQAAAIVHQGGVGTTGQAMRSGKPMLVVPFAHDQPDNAFRTRRLGIARSLSRKACTAERLAAELRPLLEEPSYAERAAEVGRKVRAENGVAAACDALEAAAQRAAA